MKSATFTNIILQGSNMSLEESIRGPLTIFKAQNPFTNHLKYHMKVLTKTEVSVVLAKERSMNGRSTWQISMNWTNKWRSFQVPTFILKHFLVNSSWLISEMVATNIEKQYRQTKCRNFIAYEVWTLFSG